MCAGEAGWVHADHVGAGHRGGGGERGTSFFRRQLEPGLVQYKTIDNLGSNENAFLHSLENSKISLFLRNCKHVLSAAGNNRFPAISLSLKKQFYKNVEQLFRFSGFLWLICLVCKYWANVENHYFRKYCQEYLRHFSYFLSAIFGEMEVCLSHSFKKRDLCCKNVKAIFLFQPRGPCETEQIMEAADEDLTVSRKGGSVVRTTLRSFSHRFI